MLLGCCSDQPTNRLQYCGRETIFDANRSGMLLGCCSDQPTGYDIVPGRRFLVANIVEVGTRPFTFVMLNEVGDGSSPRANNHPLGPLYSAT